MQLPGFARIFFRMGLCVNLHNRTGQFTAYHNVGLIVVARLQSGKDWVLEFIRIGKFPFAKTLEKICRPFVVGVAHGKKVDEWDVPITPVPLGFC